MNTNLFEQDQRELAYAVQNDIEALQSEIYDLRATQQLYLIRDEVEPMIRNGFAEAINTEHSDIVQYIVELVFRKLKDIISELPEVISKDDFVDALNEFIFE